MYLWGLRLDLAGTGERTVDFSHDRGLCFFACLALLFVEMGGSGESERESWEAMSIGRKKYS